MENLSWHKIYRIFSGYLMEFYLSNKGNGAGKLLYNSCSKLDPNSQIISWLKNLKDVGSIDPIHIFASFNYWNISPEKRKDKILFFCAVLQDNRIDTSELIFTINTSKGELLDVFKYFPHINITYVVSARKAYIQEEIWEFFSYVHNNESERLKDLFSAINNSSWFGIKIESATIFMFWVNSDVFLPLDKNTVALLKENNVIKTIPKTYEKYKSLIEIKNSNLYRNLVQVAINRKFKFDLLIDEQKNIDDFLSRKLDKPSIKMVLNKNIRENRKKEIKRLDIEEVKLFYFELYIIINGKVKKIQNLSKDGFCIKDIILSNKFENTVSYPNFQIIAIRMLDNHYTKVLKSKKFYYFNKNFKIHNEYVEFTNNKSLSMYDGYSIGNINISAIVGKNGMGKSTLIELLIMAINNTAYNLRKQNNLDEIKELFYTIYTNYSLHSLNEKNYEGEWISKLFHKNDAYQTPIVIEPFRENGNIEVNRLDSLTKQRLLSTLLDPDSGVEEEKQLYVTEKQKVDKLILSINQNKLLRLVKNSKSKDISKHKKEISEADINKELLKSNNQNIINYLKITKQITFFNKNNVSYLEKIAMFYICSKIKNIAQNYFYYSNYSNDYSSKKYLDLLFKDRSHITFKLLQAINYLKYNHLNNIEESESILNIMERIKKVKVKEPNLKTIELIPPAFFTIDIMLEDGVKFDELSSGEKQKIYNISSIIYHLQNIDSSHRGSEESIKYNYVNLILDEIEMFFHPEMQKNFVTDLLLDIQNKTQFDNITGINIILITHSPFILSDITKSNTLYLGKNEDKIEETFGANIHTLLSNSFFMKSGVMGTFAKNKIENILKTLQKSKKDKTLLSKSKMTDIKNTIYSIGEPFLKNKLMEMFLSIEDDALKEIKRLKKESEEIKKKIQILESKIKK